MKERIGVALLICGVLVVAAIVGFSVAAYSGCTDEQIAEQVTG